MLVAKRNMMSGKKLPRLAWWQDGAYLSIGAPPKVRPSDTWSILWNIPVQGGREIYQNSWFSNVVGFWHLDKDFNVVSYHAANGGGRVLEDNVKYVAISVKTELKDSYFLRYYSGAKEYVILDGKLVADGGGYKCIRSRFSRSYRRSRASRARLQWKEAA